MPSDVSLMAKKFYFFDCLLDGVRFTISVFSVLLFTDKILADLAVVFEDDVVSAAFGDTRRGYDG